MGGASVWIAGSYQSEYARDYAREGLEISDMVAEVNMRNAKANPLAQTRGWTFDAARQVTGQAGETQAENARTFATLNIGGSLTTTVSFVVTRED